MNIRNLLRVYSARLTYAIAGVMACLAFAVYLGIASIQLYDQIFWKRYFDQVTLIGDQCKIIVLNQTHLNRDQILSIPNPTYISVKMPHRGQPNAPRVLPNQTLYTQCQVDFSKIKRHGFAWISLGRSFGQTMVYLNGEEIVSSTNANGEYLEFPVPPTARGNLAALEIISTGTDEGSSGLATLNPPFMTDNIDQLKNIKRSLTSSLSEQSLTHSISAFILFAFFFGLWIYGMKYRDLFWIIIFSGALCVMHGLRYYRQFDFIWFRDFIPRINSGLYFTSILAQIMFLVSFTRDQKLSRMVQNILAPITGILVVLALTVSNQTFLDWKMLVLLPTIYGQIALLVLITSLVITTKKSNSPLLITRARRSIYLCILVFLILMIQSLVDHKYGIYIDAIAQSICLTSFAVIMLWDLLKRQSDYFLERSERILKEQKLREAHAVTRTVKYLAQDLLKPFNLLNLFSGGLAHVPPGDLQKYCEQFQKSLHHAKTDAESMMHQLLLSSEENTNLTASATDFAEQMEALKISYAESFRDTQIHYEFHSAIDSKLRLDPLTFKRVISNIIDNAIKAMRVSSETGPKKIDVCGLKENNFAVITIFNNHSYIPQEQRNSIFLLGERLGTHGRFGLGLSFVKSTVDEIGGSISCDSNEDGTTFTLNIPMELNLVDSFSPETGVSPISLKDIPTICVVDDDEFILMQWQQYVRAHPEEYRVDTFNNPLDLLKRCQEFPNYLSTISLILMDEVFPDKNLSGSKIAAKLQRLDGCPKIASTSVLMKQNSSLPYADKQPKKLAEILP